jgi:hypothetical protein
VQLREGPVVRQVSAWRRGRLHRRGRGRGRRGNGRGPRGGRQRRRQCRRCCDRLRPSRSRSLGVLALWPAPAPERHQARAGSESGVEASSWSTTE